MRTTTPQIEERESVAVIRRRFGPKLTEKELTRRNYANTLGDHAGCWVNGSDCGDDCLLGHHDGSPEAVSAGGAR